MMNRTAGISSGRRTIAVLGAGVVGTTLAAGWARAGHRLIFGSRTPRAPRVLEAVAGIDGDVTTAAHAEAARDADVVVVAVPGDQVDSLLDGLGDALSGRVTIDTTNDRSLRATSLHHRDALARAGAEVYRAFNSVGWEQMADPVVAGTPGDMVYAGPEDRRPVVEELISDLGFRPVWFGEGSEAFDLTDHVARLWFRLVLQLGWPRRIGFKVLTPADDSAGATHAPN